MKLNAALTEKICALIREGVSQERAAWACNVDDATIWRWKRRGQVEEAGVYRDFWEAYRKAEGDMEVLALSIINQAGRDGDWKAIAWRLERMNPDRFGLKVSVLHSEREKLADDILARLRPRLDSETFERVAAALVASCSDEDNGVIELASENEEH